MDKPDTGAGKFVGSMCAVFGIFTLILPIPIVVNSFSAFYRNRLWRNEVAIKRHNRNLQALKDHPEGGGGGANGTSSAQPQMTAMTAEAIGENDGGPPPSGNGVPA